MGRLTQWPDLPHNNTNRSLSSNALTRLDASLFRNRTSIEQL